MTDIDVVVVGAGPAGLAAADAAARAGARTLVVDESPIPGGQYLRPRPPRPATHPLLERFATSGAESALGEVVWHVDADRRRVRTTSLDLAYRSLVVATGAYDRPLAVAGGDLGGVVTAGAAQALAKDGVRIGRSVLIAGTGPFALPVAYELHRAGSRVAEIALTHLPWLGPAPLYAPEVVAEALRYGTALLRGRVPVRGGWALERVLGRRRVEGAVLVGTPGGRHAGARREVECDAVALGYGFLPQLAVADLAGCRLRFDRRQRTWFVDAGGDDQRTSVAGVFAAGEVVGIGGHREAVAEGAVAGRAAARFAGEGPRGAIPPGRRRRTARFARAAQRALAPPPLASLIADEAVVCRCERIDAAAIRAAASDGAGTVAGVRMRTRAGMGTCQGRMCAQLCGELVEDVLDAPPGSAGRLAARTPARPTTVGEMVP